MTGCDRCDHEGGFLFDCEYCGGRYCSDHQPAEAHGCAGLQFVSYPGSDETGDAGTTQADAVGATDRLGTVRAAIPDPALTNQRVRSLRSRVRSIGSKRPSLPDETVVVAALAIVAVVATVVTGLVPYPGIGANAAGVAGPADPTSTATVNRTAVERLVHAGINDRRADRGLETVAYDPELARIASSHSNDMAERGYRAHESPEGMSVVDRYRRAGYDCEVAGETLLFLDLPDGLPDGGGNGTAGASVVGDGASSVSDAEARLASRIVSRWMASEPHRRSLLSASWTRQGIGVAVDDGTVYVTRNTC